MKVLTTTVARIMFAVPMAIFGIFHFMNAKGMAEMLLSGWPLAEIIVYVTGLILIAAAVALIAKKYDFYAAMALGVFMVLTALLIHLPAVMGGDQMAMSMLLKDIALAGGAFTIAGVVGDA